MSGERIPNHAFDGITFRSASDERAFKRWLGMLNQRRAAMRCIYPYANIDISGNLAKRFCAATYPWRADQYPGKSVLLSEIMGISPASVVNTLATGKVSPPSAGRAAKWARAKAAELIALADELDRVPANPRHRFPKKKPGDER